MTVRRIVVALVGLILAFIAGGVPKPSIVDAQHIGPGGAMALAPGPQDVRGFVRVVDGDTLDVYIRDPHGQSQRVAVGLIGVQAGPLRGPEADPKRNGRSAYSSYIPV